MSKYHKKVLRKQGECIFGNEKPVSLALCILFDLHITLTHAKIL